MVYIANTLILVPLLLKSLGKERFAILALVTPFLRYGFTGVFDPGVAAGVTRFTSRSFANSETEAVNSYISSSIAVYLAIGIVLLAVYYFLGPLLMPHVIRTNAELFNEAKITFTLALWIYILFSISNPFFALLIGIRRVEVTHWIGTSSLLLELGGILLLLPGKLTLTGVMWVYGANAIIGLVLSVFLARHFFPHLQVNSRLVSGRRTREILGYGGKFSGTTMATILSPVLDKLILARYTGLPEVAFYEAGSRFVDLLRRATQLLLLPLFPMAAAHEGTHTERERHDFYAGVFSANILISSGLYLVPAALAFGIFRAWLGPGSRAGAIAFLVLCATVFCQALVGPISMIFGGTGRLKPLMITAMISLLANVTISPLLAHYFGFKGVLLGTFLGYGVVSLGFLAWTSSVPEFHVSLKRLARVSILPILAAFLPGTVLMRALHVEQQSFGPRGMCFVGITAFAVFLASSLIQPEHRFMILKAFHLAGARIGENCLKRKLSDA